MPEHHTTGALFPDLADKSLAELDSERLSLIGNKNDYTELSEEELERLSAILGEMRTRTTPATEKRRAVAKPKKAKIDIFAGFDDEETTSEESESEIVE